MSSVQAHLDQTDNHGKAEQEEQEHAEGYTERQSGKNPTMTGAPASSFIFVTVEGLEIGTATTGQSHGKDSVHDPQEERHAKFDYRSRHMICHHGPF
jgi:hypothetical protein